MAPNAFQRNILGKKNIFVLQVEYIVHDQLDFCGCVPERTFRTLTSNSGSRLQDKIRVFTQLQCQSGGFMI